jgi:hypothetical protein
MRQFVTRQFAIFTGFYLPIFFASSESKFDISGSYPLISPEWGKAYGYDHAD